MVELRFITFIPLAEIFDKIVAKPADSVAVVNADHDHVIKWKHFPRCWPFVRGIHRSPVNSPHKVQWRDALMFALICAWINGWVTNGEAGDLRRHRAHYDTTVMDHGWVDGHRGQQS